MMSIHDTRVAFFGGAYNTAALDAIVGMHQAGFDVVVGAHDPRESIALHEAGIQFITDKHEAVAGRDIVISSLPTPADVEEFYLGDDGVLELMEPGTFVIDLSFSTPQLAREIQALAAIGDLDALDAPIINLDENEDSIVFIGGEEETLKALSPIFPFLAKNIYPENSPGAGQFAAMLAYIGFTGALMGAIESMSIARIGGFSEKAALDAMALTIAGSRALVEYAPRMLKYDFGGHIRVASFLDALEVVLETAESLDVTVPMIETAYQLYDLLSVVGGDELNIQALSLLYEDEETCTAYGLDWSLADTNGEGKGGMIPEFNIESFFPQDFPFDATHSDDNEDEGDEGESGHTHGHGHRGGPPEGFSPIGGFFSKN